MNVQAKKLPKSTVQLTIELTPEEFAVHQQAACERVSGQVNTPGFRKGKAPYNVLVQKVGKDIIEAETRDIALQKSFIKAASDEGLHVIARPEVKIIKEEPFTVEFIVPVMPDVEVNGHEKIKIKKEEAKINDKEVDEVIENLRTRSATFTDIDRAIKKGDRAEIEMSGFDEAGVELDKVKSSNHPVVVGDGMLIPGFEDELVGLKKDEEKEFTLIFPADYHDKSFQKKKVKFKVKINRTEERILPEINEEFIEKVSAKKQTLDQFKVEIKAELIKAKEQELDEKRKNEYFDEVIKITKVELPDALIEQESADMLHQLKHDIEHRGLTFEKYLEMTKKTEEDLKKENRKQAEDRIKLRFAMRKIFEAENIVSTPEEIEAEIDHVIAHNPPEHHAEIRKHYKKGSHGWEQLASKILLDKLFAKVLA